MTSFMEQVEGSQPQTTEGNQSPTDNQQQEKPFLQVGERVFKTPEDAIKHIDSAQQHIQKLEKDWESATALVERQDQLLEKAARVDELMSAVEQNSSRNTEGTTQLSKEEVIAEAITAFEQRQQVATIQEQQAQNWNTVTGTLTKLYGDKTDEVVQKVAGENDMTLEEAAELAKTKPKVFLKMFDSPSSMPTAKPNTS